MKNSLSIALFFLLETSFLFAQSGVTGTGLPNATKGIVRTGNISYYEDGDRGYFTDISDINGTFHNVKVPEKWTILDFRVQNDTVYFCGVDGALGGALLGYFDPTSLSSGSTVQFYFDKNISQEFASLNRMAILQSKTKTALMAIGTAFDLDPDKVGAERLIYFDSFPGPGYVFQPESNELFWDVTTVDRYFVSIGTAGTHTNVVTLRSGDALAGVFASSPSFYQCNSFVLSGGDLFVGGLRSASLQNSDIASIGHFNNSSTIRHGFYCFVFDASSGLMVNNQRCAIGHTGITSNFPPKELAYLSDSSVLMVTEESPFIAYKGVLKLKPYFNSYTFYETPYYFKCNNSTPQSVGFKSIKPLSSNAAFATSGDQWMKLVLDGSLPTWGYVNNCIGSFTADVFTWPLLSPQLSNNGFILDYMPIIESKSQSCGSVDLSSCSDPYNGLVIEVLSSDIDKQ